MENEFLRIQKNFIFHFFSNYQVKHIYQPAFILVTVSFYFIGSIITQECNNYLLRENFAELQNS